MDYPVDRTIFGGVSMDRTIKQGFLVDSILFTSLPLPMDFFEIVRKGGFIAPRECRVVLRSSMTAGADVKR